MTDTTDLAAWLRAQLDEDEQVARDAAMATGLTGYGDDLVADGQHWVAGYHIVERQRRAVGQKTRTVAECAAFGASGVAKHIARHDPARVLRAVGAKRELLALHRPDSDDRPECVRCGPPYPCTTVRVLATEYADQPGYWSEWRP